MDGRIFALVILSSLTTFISGYPQDINDFLFGGGVEFIDMSWPFDNNTLYWPGGQKFEFTKKKAGMKPGEVWYSANEFCAAEHGGTHMDAPYHFGSDKWTVGRIPFENLITPLIVVDLSSVVARNPDFILEKHHMDHLFVGDTKRNFTVFFRFGWSQYYDNPTKYFGSNNLRSDKNLHFPGIGVDVAKWIVENKNLVGVGVDTPSVDPGISPNQAHQVFSARNIFNLENVKMDRTLPSNKCAVAVMPMKILDGTGAPCRVTAICPRLHSDGFF